MRRILAAQFLPVLRAWRDGYEAEVRRCVIAFFILIFLAFGVCLAVPEVRIGFSAYLRNLYQGMDLTDEAGALSPLPLFLNNLRACGVTMLYGLIPFVRLPALALGLNAFINAQGFARTGMLTVALGAGCNIVLDPIFIFALDMGVQGAALATVLSQGASCLWILCFLRGKQTTLRLQRRTLRLRRKILLPCLALGVSPFIMQFTESILNVCFNTSLLQYGGNLAVGAMTILASVMQFAMLPLQGFTQGAQPIVGFNYGAGNRDRVKETFRRLLVCCIVYAGIIWAVAMFLPQVFTAIFTNDPTLAEYTQWAIRIYLALAFLMGIQVACQQTFIALGNAKTSVFLALLRKVILLIPLIYLLPHLLPGNQVMAVFLAEPVADAIAVATTGTLFWRQYHKL